MVWRVERGPSSSPWRRVVVCVVVSLATAALFPALALAQSPAKVAIDHLEIPEFIGPSAAAAGVGATYAVLPTDGLESHGSTQFRFFLRQTIDVRNPAGTHVRTLTAEKELLPPLGPNASRPAPVSLNEPWDGKDDGGALLPEGHYGVTVSGTVVRVKNPPPGQPPAPPGFVHVIGSASGAGTTILDFTPPVLAAAPNAALVHRLALEVLLTYSDGGSGVNLRSLRASANGQDASSALTDVTPTSARLVLSGPALLHERDNLLAFALADNAGNLKTAEAMLRILIPHHIAAEPLPPVVMTHARTTLAGTVYNVDGVAVPGVSEQFARGAGTTTFENAGAGPVSGTTGETGRVALAAFPGFGDNVIRLALPDFPAVAPVDLATRGAALFRVALTPAGPIQAGTARSLTLLAIDASSAPISEYLGIADVRTTDVRSLLNHFSVAFDGSEGGTITADYAAFFVTAGTQSITVNDTRDPGLVSTLDGIVVVPGPAARFVPIAGIGWTTVSAGMAAPDAVTRILDGFDNGVPGREVSASVSRQGLLEVELSALTNAQGVAALVFAPFMGGGVRAVRLTPTGTGLPPIDYEIIVVEPQAAGTIGAAGGEVAVGDAASPAFGARLVVPAGSVANGVPFAIGALALAGSGLPPVPQGMVAIGSAVDFGPARAPLTGPVTLVVPYREGDIPAGVAEGSMVLLRFDLATRTWVPMADAILDTAANTFTVVVGDLAGTLCVPAGSESAPSWPPPAVALEKVSGDGQQGVIGHCARAPLVVRAVDDEGVPIAGVPVAWTVAGDAQLHDAAGYSSYTNDQGLAGVGVTLGSGSEIRAGVAGRTDVTPVVFHATGLLPWVRTTQLYPTYWPHAGEPSDQPLTITVRDPWGQPMVGVEVAGPDDSAALWVLPTHQKTDAAGEARFILIGHESVDAALRLPEVPRFYLNSAYPAVSQIPVSVRPSAGLHSVVRAGQGQVALPKGKLGPVNLDFSEVKTWYDGLKYHSFAGVCMSFDGQPGYYPLDSLQVCLKGLIAPNDCGAIVLTFGIVDSGAPAPYQPPPIQGPGVSRTGGVLTLDFSQGVPASFQDLDDSIDQTISAMIGYGPEETLLVAEDPAHPGQFVAVSTVLDYDPSRRNSAGEQILPVGPQKMRLEARLPLAEPATTTGGLSARNACGEPRWPQPGDLAPCTLVDLPVVRGEETPRFAVYRSTEPLVAVGLRVGEGESRPPLPTGYRFFQLPPDGFVNGHVFGQEAVLFPSVPGLSIKHSPFGPTSAFYQEKDIRPIPSVAILQGDPTPTSLVREIRPRDAVPRLSFGLGPQSVDAAPELPQVETPAPFGIPQGVIEVISMLGIRHGKASVRPSYNDPVGDTRPPVVLSPCLDVAVYKPLAREITVNVWLVVDQHGGARRPQIAANQLGTNGYLFSQANQIWHPYGMKFSLWISAQELQLNYDLGDVVMRDVQEQIFRGHPTGGYRGEPLRGRSAGAGGIAEIRGASRRGLGGRPAGGAERAWTSPE